MHQKWLQSLNANRTNHFVDLERANATIQSQKLVIAQLELEIQHMTITIQCLSRQLSTIPPTQQLAPPAINLLDFD